MHQLNLIPSSPRDSPEGGELVYVEQKPREMADEKDDDESHEDSGQVVLLLAPRLVCYPGRRGRRGYLDLREQLVNLLELFTRPAD